MNLLTRISNLQSN